MNPSALPPSDPIIEEGLFIQHEWRITPWAGLERKQLKIKAGRGNIALVSHPRGVLLERAYRHGGLRRFLLADWFWHNSRPSHEFRMHRRVFEARIPTVEPVGWREQPGTLSFFRKYWYYSVYLPGAQPFPSFLKSTKRANHLIPSAAHILKALYDQGIYHADLNLNNWLIWMDECRVIDFDKAKNVAWDPTTYLKTCFQRMVRSAVKLGLSNRRRLFFRLVLITSRLFGLNARQILAKIPEDITRISALKKLRWRLSGGHKATND